MPFNTTSTDHQRKARNPQKTNYKIQPVPLYAKDLNLNVIASDMLHSKKGHPKTNPNLSNNSSMVGNLIRPDQLNQIVLSYNPFPTKSKNLGEVVYCIYPGLLDVGGVGSEALASEAKSPASILRHYIITITLFRRGETPSIHLPQ